MIYMSTNRKQCRVKASPQIHYRLLWRFTHLRIYLISTSSKEIQNIKANTPLIPP